MIEDERRVAGVAIMDDCQSFSSKPKWMERECQSLMCLTARRDIEIERVVFYLLTQCTRGVSTNLVHGYVR